MVVIKKVHGNKTNALHFLKIAYKKLGCFNPCEKLGRFNLYDWFIDRKEVEAEYAHLAKLGTRVQTRKYNLLILENYLVFRNSMVAMLQKTREGGQPL
jgi:hypothetical protein